VDYLNAQQLKARLPWPSLIDGLADIFVRDVCEPVRHHHTIAVPDEPDATLLLMPAWIEGAYFGVKQVAVFPGNSLRGIPGLNGSYLLSDARNGTPLLQLDANELTARRTAAASALASRYLSRPDSGTLLLMGAGRLASALVEAHSAIRSITQVHIWSRTQASAEALVNTLIADGVSAHYCATKDLPATVAQADIISCATMAIEPIIEGHWLSPGTHLDLVGAFRPDMRETDNLAIQKSDVFVDTRAGTLAEAGDLIQAIREGAFAAEQIVAELSELCSKNSDQKHAGRAGLNKPDQAITLFKSVGAAREDLAAAILAYEAGCEQQHETATIA